MSCASQPSHSRPHMNDVVNQLKEAVETERVHNKSSQLELNLNSIVKTRPDLDSFICSSSNV
ncbi:hypothetical protein EJ110_NYTH11820 [Nymphaea thermarum]|nr:hypothetical protein EJ110_NYTH11820 [Nymphaea thermarum]